MSLTQVSPTRVIDSRHPSFLSSITDWEKWRMTYRGGDEFRLRYLEQFSQYEDRQSFYLRRRLTPIPSFAKAAINDIRNSIFQRMRDISRIGGSDGYQEAVWGKNYGVDRRGSTMNAFLGMKVLTELLVMGRVGVYVDNSVVSGSTMADTQDATPYLYTYQIEDILSWTCTSPDDPSMFQSVLLRDTCLDYDRRTLLPLQTFQRFRLLWLDQDSGKVMLQFYDMGGQEIDRDGNPSVAPYQLNLNRIPFVMPDIADSLIKDVCNHQIALLNLTSRDIWYALQANFPFYIEQRDMRAIGSHLKPAANADGTATQGGQTSSDENIMVGANQGRAYDKGVNAPGFIHPSSEPLKASIALQEKYEEDIRKLVNLAVQSMASRASAESKSLDNAGLEAGLSFIGLVLEQTERQITQYWAAYEEKSETKRKVATIKYPDRYSLKTDTDRIDEATKLSKLIYSLPGQEAKREIAKSIVMVLLGGKIDVSTIDSIRDEIDACDYLTSEPNTIIQAVEAGLCGQQTGSKALGFADDEYKQAQEDHFLRAMRIQAAQAIQAPGPTRPSGSKEAERALETNPQDKGVQIFTPDASLPNPDPQTATALSNPAGRGVPDLDQKASADAAKDEKTQSRNTDFSSTTKKPVRGNSKQARVTGKKGKR